MNILQIHTSARRFENGQGSVSAQLAGELVDGLLQRHPGARRVLRDFALQPHPALDESALQALMTPAEARTPEQAARVALDDALIAEAQAADVIVLAVPMYNFGVTTQFKSWVDALARVGVTFRYSDKGPIGLLRDRPVYVVLTRGGLYRDQPHDHQTPYLRQVLAFLGLRDVRFIHAEGLSRGPEALARGLADARATMAQWLQASAQPEPA